MGNLVLAGATSGSTTITPTDGVTATLTLPSTTGTLALAGASSSSISNGTSNVTVNSSGGTVTIATAGTTALTVDTTQTFLIGSGVVSASSSGGLNVNVTQAGSSSVPLVLQNQSTSNGSGVYLAYRGKNSGGSQADYNYIQFVADSTSAGTSSMRFYTANGSGPVETMRLNSSGNLGIGVTPSAWGSTAKALQIGSNTNLYTDGANGNSLFSRNSYYDGSNNIYQINSYATRYYQNGSGVHYWEVAPSGTAGNSISFTTAMTLDNSGNLLVGGTGQVWDEKLLVRASTNNVLFGVYGSSASYTSSAIRCQVDTAAGTGWYFFEGRSSGGTFQYGIRGNGTVATSDERRKKNIEPARNYLEDICKIPVIKYNWKSDEDGALKELGWIAQDVEKVFPNMVVTHHDGPNNDQEVLLLKKEVFLPMLMKSIQELSALVTAQSATITSLTERITALEGK